MPLVPNFRESVLAARQRLDDERAAIRQQHDAGSPGIQVSARLCSLLDEVVLSIYQSVCADQPAAVAQVLAHDVTLVAHGGYGRGDVAPYSDVDLMILYRPSAAKEVPILAERLLRDLFDVGLEVGQSVRTVDQACDLAMSDATICTALIESRYLAGDERLFQQFHEKFKHRLRKNAGRLFTAIEQARRTERNQYGETVYLLEPNVKRSRGCLRDIQLLRWLGFVSCGESQLDNLALLGHLTREDHTTLQNAREFLLRLRNEMHFKAGKAADVLDKSEQLRIANLWGFPGDDGLLPVERFMSEFFRHTHAVRAVAAHFVAAVRPGRAWEHLLDLVFSHQVERDYRVTPRHIEATSRGLQKLSTDMAEVLRLADLANHYNKRIADKTWQAIRTSLPQYSQKHDDHLNERFLSLLSQPAQLGDLLHRLHELGVLEKILPAFAHARSLLQFNEYHKYTVDEHCLRAVKSCTEYLSATGLVGDVYRGIKNKRLLHLALLIHDLGKGFTEDHSEVGARIADQVSRDLRLPLREAETLRFLVLKHLAMSHLAFRRDTSDSQLIVRFAVEVGSPDALDMLFVLTAADFSAVGPGVWNDWKAEVLGDLYKRTMEHLAGDARVGDDTRRFQARVTGVRNALGSIAEQPWFSKQLRALPAAYLLSSPPTQIAAELQALQTLASGEVRTWASYTAETHTVEYVIGTHESITPGVFHRLTGALASQGVQVLSAQINTLAEGLVLDRFYVVDPDHAADPPEERMAQVQASLVEALRNPKEGTPKFRQTWQSTKQKQAAELVQLPTRVRADNDTSENYTILDIFARDRQGLLYAISRTLFDLGLSVSLAKIGTYLDQVVDVFYVTDATGNKIQSDEQIAAIVDKLLVAIEQL
jgi:[protein-PII] uridylyltransferase